MGMDMAFLTQIWNVKSKYQKVVILSISIITIINILLVHPTFSDDIFYFNVAKQIREGRTPYIHFFFAHPPLHEFILAFLMTIYPSPILIGKLLAVFSSSISALLLFLIGSKKYGEREACLATLFLLTSPAFLAFSSIGYGIWEMLLFLTISLYFFSEGRIFWASFSFLMAFLTRYMALLYLPVYFFFDPKKFRNFSRNSMFLIPFSLLLLGLIFGENFFRDTILFHFTKVDLPKFPIEYFKMHLHFPLLSLFLLILEKKKEGYYALPIMMDVFFLIFLRHPHYHYFIPSLPIYCLTLGNLTNKDWKKVSVIFIAASIALIFNLRSLDFYLNPKHSWVFEEVSKVIESITSEDDEIFGEPIITNYVSLTSNRRIYRMWLDSFPTHLSYEHDKLLTHFMEEKPRVFLDCQIESFSYSSQLPELSEFLKNYELKEEIFNLLKVKIYVLR